MIRSGFFNSMNGDRKYDASKFAEYFASFIGNGVFPDSLQVISNNNMTVTVKPGKAWINGYIMINDADYILNINAADGVLNRTDRIVLRHDVADREIRLEVKQGEFASSPVAPSLQRDADAYELCIANITVSAGAISITQDKITDTRLNTDLCGKVDTLIAGDYLALINTVNNKFDKASDSKDLTVTFTEATSDADIASGDTHSTLFGKLLKNLNTLRESLYNIVNGGTTVGKAVTLNGLLSTIAELNFVKGVTSAIQTQLNGKAPTNHASTGATYGVGTPTNYGHCRTWNALDVNSHVDGLALSAYQGALLRGAVNLGKCSKMSSTAKVAKNGTTQYASFIPFNVENQDDFNAINLAISNTKITVPSGVSRVKFFFKGTVIAMLGSYSVNMDLYKNGVKLETLIALSINGGSSSEGHSITGKFESALISCNTGDYFELYVFTGGSWATYPTDIIPAGYIFGMEVLL